MNPIQLLKKLIRDVKVYGKHYGWKYAFYNLLWWLCFYLRFPFSLKLSTIALEGKTRCLEKFLEKNYANEIAELKSESKSTPVNDYKIWVFWGQGEENMPILVERCYNQLKQLHQNVVLITADNVSQYINLPEVLYEKVKACELSWAHFSDIIRTTLLAKYGGLWIDSTVWVPKELPIEKFKTMPFYSANYKAELNSRSVRFWTSYDWSWNTWCMGSGEINNKLFNFVSQVMADVAANHACWPDYVFQDFLIYYACTHCADVKRQIESVDIKNPYRNQLAALMDKPFNKYEWNNLVENEIVFKLSYRANWPLMNGGVTYYGKFIKGEL